ncbi:MAG: CRISPR-associated endonuclease Cas9 REC1/REC2 domain-containing protein, partial [Oscillospiraceae bacterium]
KIFNEINDENFDKIEKLILWITLFEDKKILKRKIKTEMQEMTDKQIEKIAKLRYSGWSRLSKELLTEIKSPDENGKIKSIIEIMRDEKLN